MKPNGTFASKSAELCARAAEAASIAAMEVRSRLAFILGSPFGCNLEAGDLSVCLPSLPEAQIEGENLKGTKESLFFSVCQTETWLPIPPGAKLAPVSSRAKPYL